MRVAVVTNQSPKEGGKFWSESFARHDCDDFGASSLAQLIVLSWVFRAFKAVTNTHLENTLIGRLLQGDGGGGDRGGL